MVMGDDQNGLALIAPGEQARLKTFIQHTMRELERMARPSLTCDAVKQCSRAGGIMEH